MDHVITSIPVVHPHTALRSGCGDANSEVISPGSAPAVPVDVVVRDVEAGTDLKGADELAVREEVVRGAATAGQAAETAAADVERWFWETRPRPSFG